MKIKSKGEFEALGYPNTLAIYLSAEASKVQGGRGGVFQQVPTIACLAFSLIF